MRSRRQEFSKSCFFSVLTSENVKEVGESCSPGFLGPGGEAGEWQGAEKPTQNRLSTCPWGHGRGVSEEVSLRWLRSERVTLETGDML